MKYIITNDEWNDVINECKNPHDRVLLHLIRQGLNAAEIASILVSHINFDHKIIEGDICGSHKTFQITDDIIDCIKNVLISTSYTPNGREFSKGNYLVKKLDLPEDVKNIDCGWKEMTRIQLVNRRVNKRIEKYKVNSYLA